LGSSISGLLPAMLPPPSPRRRERLKIQSGGSEIEGEIDCEHSILPFYGCDDRRKMDVFEVKSLDYLPMNPGS